MCSPENMGDALDEARTGRCAEWTMRALDYARTWGGLPASITLAGLCGRRRGDLSLGHEAAAPDHARDSLDRGRDPDDVCAGHEPRRDHQGAAPPHRPRDRGGRHRPLLSLVGTSKNSSRQVAANLTR